jgi:SWI/SNF-related matrix-associated actin-dependent regulator 1 of chromatin subfamily A
LEDIDLSKIEQTITDSLMPFQREGIRYAISRNGRVLIADDMGLGKTIQALGLASFYMDQDAWPFLVVAPSSMKYTWQTSVLRWFPFLTADNIAIINKGKDSVLENKEAAVFIISYNLLSQKSKELLSRGFKLVIMDESHCIKNDKSARTKAAEPIMQKSKFLILLTGSMKFLFLEY